MSPAVERLNLAMESLPCVVNHREIWWVLQLPWCDVGRYVQNRSLTWTICTQLISSDVRERHCGMLFMLSYCDHASHPGASSKTPLFVLCMDPPVHFDSRLIMATFIIQHGMSACWENLAVTRPDSCGVRRLPAGSMQTGGQRRCSLACHSKAGVLLIKPW